MINKVGKISQIALIVGMSAGLILRATPVQASRRITCESDKDRYEFCRVNTRGGVRLERQLSETRCRKGRNWGYDRDGIWVDDGCRAVFRVDSRDDDDDNGGSNTGAIIGGVIAAGAIAAIIASNSNNDNNGGSSDPTITCKSRNNDYFRCGADLRDKQVALKRQLSSAGCWQGDSWGYDDKGIWVDDGCEAEFQVRSR